MLIIRLLYNSVLVLLEAKDAISVCRQLLSAR